MMNQTSVDTGRSADPPKAKTSKAFCGIIRLNRGISKINYFGSFFHGLVLGFFLSGVELLQQNLLVSSYNCNPKAAAQWNALIILWDLLIKIIVTSFFGIMVDKLGRQKSALIGYFLIIVSLLLYPIHDYYPDVFVTPHWLFAVRFIYSNGSAIIPVIPLVADYVQESSLGKAIGINVFFVAMGFTISTAVVKQMDSYDLMYSYFVFAGFIFVAGLFYILLMKSGNQYFKKSHDPEQVDRTYSRPESDMVNSSQLTKKQLIRHNMKQKPWIRTVFVFAFINGIGLAISSQVLNLYVRNLDVGEKDSKAVGALTVFKANVASTLTSLILGPILDAINPIYISVLTFAVALSGYSVMLTVENAQDWNLTAGAILIGMGYSCSQLLTNYLGFKNYRKSIRGLLMALANTFIVFGVIISSVIGGILFTLFDPNWPFYIAVGFLVIGLLFFVFIYCKYIFGKVQDEEEGQSLMGHREEESRD